MNGSDRNDPTDTDIASDIADDSLPEEARRAILALIDEIEALRVEIESGNARIAELECLADTDPLTPVANRRAFVREIDRARAYLERYGGTATLIYLDIDGLKAVNDGHGHAAGDAALVAVATLLVENVRSSDTVGRLGGDELGVLLDRAGRPEAEEKVKALSTLIGMLRLPDLVDGIALSASFGIAEVAAGMAAEQALAEADAAMYADKERKRSV